MSRYEVFECPQCHGTFREDDSDFDRVRQCCVCEEEVCPACVGWKCPENRCHTSYCKRCAENDPNPFCVDHAFQLDTPEAVAKTAWTLWGERWKGVLEAQLAMVDDSPFGRACVRCMDKALQVRMK